MLNLSLTRQALHVKPNNYLIYKEELTKFESKNSATLKQMLSVDEPLTDVLHQDYKTLKNKKSILKNRLMDKLLWSGLG